jgi:hypothetical protein
LIGRHLPAVGSGAEENFLDRATIARTLKRNG